jgi:hypothetical protein
MDSLSKTAQSPPAANIPTSAASGGSTAGNYRLPEASTLLQCAKLSIVEDKPIMMDYWTNSIEKV